MTAGLRILIYIVVGLPVLVIVLHTIIRIVRHFHKFPMPQFMANAIDNPFRRKIQPPDKTPAPHGIEPGMTVLEVGPGNGTYTVATARRVGNKGKVVTIDIEPRMIERVTHRAQAEGIDNIEAKVTNVYDLPFEDGFFDAIYMIAVIGEIPEPDKAMREFYRVLSPSGTLAFSEFLQDPDYPRAKTLIRKAASAGFQLKKKVGNVFYYTLIFEKGRMLKEFKKFAMRGNVVDMAVGIIIGAAFGQIVTSLVNDVLMPPVGLLLGNVDFSNLFAVLKEGTVAGPYASLADAQAAGAVTVNYGVFVNTIISFVIVAFAVFLLIRSINRLQRQEEAPPAEPTTKECPHCLSTIPLKATRCPHCTSELGP